MKKYVNPELEIVSLYVADIMFVSNGEGSDTTTDGSGLWG